LWPRRPCATLTPPPPHTHNRYQKILEMDRQNAHALTELIKCFAEYDLDTAEQYSEQLPPVSTDGPALDVDLLERASRRKVARAAAPAGAAASSTAAAAAAAPGAAARADGDAGATEEHPSELAAAAAAAAAERPKRKRKKRAAKLPKDYNPNIPPDPERWLPRHERAEYKKRFKKKAALHHAIARGPQGASQADAQLAAEKLAAAEAAKEAAAAKAEAAAAAMIAQQAARKKKQHQKKKK
jgi:signal recognition particle subunit SRP72